MNHVEIIHRSLSSIADIVTATSSITRESIYAKTQDFILLNSAEWKKENPQIDYSDPYCRLAYVYMNVGIHSYLVDKALTRFSPIRNLITAQLSTSRALNVCALGGGPGSELLGLASFVERLNKTERPLFVDFLLVDLIKEWDESWQSLKEGVHGYMRAHNGHDRMNWPLIVSRSFLPVSAIEVDDFSQLPTRFHGTELYIFSYLVSELKPSLQSFEEVVGHLTRAANSEAVFLFIDRNERSVREAVESIIADNPDLSMVGMHQDRGKYEVDLSKLGEWYTHIKPLPRQNWLAFFALAKHK